MSLATLEAPAENTDELTVKPYITEDGTLVVPGECSDNRYKWWKKEGMSLAELLEELDASREVWERYTDLPYFKDKNDEQGSD